MSSVRSAFDSGSRILAVDDVEAKRYAWQRILTRAGFSVSTASSGQEALNAYTQAKAVWVETAEVPPLGFGHRPPG